MAPTCLMCSTSISRNTEYLTCSKNNSHLFHINCVHLEISEYEFLKKSGEIKLWKCGLCTSYHITSINNEKISSSLANNYMEHISKMVKSITENLEMQLHGVIDELRGEVMVLRQENLHFKSIVENFTTRKTPTVLPPEKSTILQSIVQKPLKPRTDNTKRINAEKEWSDIVSNVSGSNSNEIVAEKSETENNENDGFQPVITRKRMNKNRKSIIGTGKIDDFKANILFSHAHISNLSPDVTEEKIIQYLNKNNIKDASCKKLISNRPEEYSSFKVSVPKSSFDTIKDPSLWPEGTRINNFLFHLSKNHPPSKR